MSKVNLSPLMTVTASFVKVEKLAANSDFNQSDRDKFKMVFNPSQLFLNGTVALDGYKAAEMGLELFMNFKVGPEVWARIAPLLKDKVGTAFEILCAPESYSMSLINHGVWYQFYNIEPI